MKPYSETHTNEGVIDAPIEQVWALHTNADAMCEVFSRVVAMDVIKGRLGEVGCVARMTMRTPRGRVGTADAETIEAEPPRRIVTRTAVLEGAKTTLITTRTFTSEGNRTRTTLTATSETRPLLAVVRWMLRLTRKGRALLSTDMFEQDVADENVYHAQHRDGPAAH